VSGEPKQLVFGDWSTYYVRHRKPKWWEFRRRLRARRWCRAAKVDRITIPADEGGLYHISAHYSFADGGPATRYVTNVELLGGDSPSIRSLPCDRCGGRRHAIDVTSMGDEVPRHIAGACPTCDPTFEETE
jgi:hypothetical protein